METFAVVLAVFLGFGAVIITGLIFFDMARRQKYTKEEVKNLRSLKEES